MPRGVVCLLSALRFHGLTTQAPFEVWLAIENKSIAPKLDYPPLRIVRFSGAAFTEGVEEHIVDGVTRGTSAPQAPQLFNVKQHDLRTQKSIADDDVAMQGKEPGGPSLLPLSSTTPVASNYGLRADCASICFMIRCVCPLCNDR